MNKNEIIEWLHALRSACEDMELVRANFEDYRKPHHMIVRKLIHEVIGALEDISAEDCVSRQAAIYAIKHAQVNFSVESEIDFTKHEREVHEIIENVLGAQEKALKELPPVTPAEKVGRWIDAEVLDKIRAEINSPNRGTCDYFIVDRIEEIIDKYKAEPTGAERSDKE
jgi:methyl coenzyme M reductase subunit C-like uncharacterized protein (methanogenesis marker protein 7)